MGYYDNFYFEIPTLFSIYGCVRKFFCWWKEWGFRKNCLLFSILNFHSLIFFLNRFPSCRWLRIGLGSVRPMSMSTSQAEEIENSELYARALAYIHTQQFGVSVFVLLPTSDQPYYHPFLRQTDGQFSKKSWYSECSDQISKIWIHIVPFLSLQ